MAVLNELVVKFGADITALQQGVAKANATLDGITASGKKADTSLGGVTRAAGTLSRQSAGASAGLNSVRSSMTTLAASALSTAPGVAQLGGVIGSLALGSGVMIGVLAGMTALGYAWEFITRKAREAKEEQKEAIDRLQEGIDKARLGVSGTFPGDVAQARAAKLKDEEKLREVNGTLAMLALKGETGSVAHFEAERNKLIASVERYRQLINFGEGESKRLQREEGERLKTQREAAEALARTEEKAAQGRADQVRLAQQAAALAGTEGDAQKKLKIAFDAVNAAIAARRNLSEDQLRITLASIEAERKLSLLRVNIPEARLADSSVVPNGPTAPITFGGRTIGAMPALTAPGGVPVRGSVSTAPTFLQGLGAGLKDAANTLSSKFTPALLAGGAAFAFLAPVFRGFSEKIGPAVQGLTAPLIKVGEILGTLIVPVLRLLFDPLKWLGVVVAMVGESVARVASWVLDFIAAMKQALGGLLVGIGELLNKLPGSIGNPLKRYGESLLEGAEDYKDRAAAARGAAEEMERQQKELMGLKWEDATAPLKEAAREAAYNVSEAFDANRRRLQVTGGLGRSISGGARVQATTTFAPGAIVLQAAPGEDPVAFGRKMLDAIRLLRGQGGTTELDLAILGVG